MNTKPFVLAAFAAFAVYLCGAFVNAGFNISECGEFSRIYTAFCMAGGAVAAAAFGSDL